MESFSDAILKRPMRYHQGMQLKRFNICGFIFIVVLEKSVIEIFVKFSVQRSRRTTIPVKHHFNMTYLVSSSSNSQISNFLLLIKFPNKT